MSECGCYVSCSVNFSTTETPTLVTIASTTSVLTTDIHFCLFGVRVRVRVSVSVCGCTWAGMLVDVWVGGCKCGVVLDVSGMGISYGLISVLVMAHYAGVGVAVLVTCFIFFFAASWGPTG